MKTKKKNAWYIWLSMAAVLLCAVIQFMLTLSRDAHSRWLAEQAAEGLLLCAEGLAEDADARREALRLNIAENSAPALEEKARRMEDRKLLTLVNPWNKVPEGYVPELTDIGDDQAVDSRCAAAVLKMLEDCKAAGCLPVVCSSYRTEEMQLFLYNNKVQRLLDEGVGYYDVYEVAARSVAIPGTSEHQLGLAVDIIDEYYPYLNYLQENTYTQRWLMEHCYDYGFILRYPNGTTDITGIIYEPWHYRYVGVDTAMEIKESGLTFEEYLPLRRGR